MPKYRDRAMSVLLDDEEYEEVRELAHKTRQSMSAWMRAAILEAAKRQRRREGRTEQVA